MSKIVILGAGPAGSSSAIQLLKAGHRVSLIDRQSFPRHVPGETLHPGVETLLEQLDVFDQVENESFLRHSGVSNIKDDKATFDSYNEKKGWAGYQLYREDFDNILLNKAISLGVDFHQGISPAKVNVTGYKIRSIEAGDNTFEADFFIDATGKRSWLAQKIGLSYTKYSKKKIAYYGYVTNREEKFSNPKLIWDQSGWTWIAQVTKEKLAWVRLDLIEYKKLSADYLPPELKGFPSIGKRKAVDVTWRKADMYCKENVFLVGDAAFILDPGSSHGILKALLSGIMVSHLINKTSKENFHFIHQYYSSWIENQFQNDYSKLKELYKEYDI